MGRSLGYNRDEMRITYRDGWTETFLTATRVVCDGGPFARIYWLVEGGPPHVLRDARDIAEVCAL
jgi:hypothetical protein